MFENDNNNINDKQRVLEKLRYYQEQQKIHSSKLIKSKEQQEQEHSVIFKARIVKRDKVIRQFLYIQSVFTGLFAGVLTAVFTKNTNWLFFGWVLTTGILVYFARKASLLSS